MSESGKIVKGKKGQTFVIDILNTQNATWQGTVLWAQTQKKVPFRSALELIRLLDSAMGEETLPSHHETEACS